jgi:hypothetical protein
MAAGSARDGPDARLAGFFEPGAIVFAMMGARWSRVAAVVAAIAGLGLLCASAALAAGSPAQRSRRAAGSGSIRIELHAPRHVLAGGLVSFTGKVSGVPSGRVLVQQRSGTRWVAIARGRAGKNGRFALTWGAPSKVFVQPTPAWAEKPVLIPLVTCASADAPASTSTEIPHRRGGSRAPARSARCAARWPVRAAAAPGRRRLGGSEGVSQPS